MTEERFVAPDDIRAAFSNAMSRMYREEVPLYGDLLDIVAAVNAAVAAARPALSGGATFEGAADRLNVERHGAIRVGTAAELAMLRRAFAVMGMFPVGYYDLAAAGVPVHSTAFRPIALQSLDHNPFRVFTSLLRLDLIADEDLRALAATILATRRIFTERAVTLIERCEDEGGLAAPDAAAFVEEVLHTFRWHSEALVDAGTYDRLNAAHRLIADIVSFKGPHINHLTPRTLDIDAAADEMRRRGIDTKDSIEGPPRRRIPILLRQTSFRAVQEPIAFSGAATGSGPHTARFGEIEQRGVALTRKGRVLYDTLLDKARTNAEATSRDPAGCLARAFADFPDDLDRLRRERLCHFRYEAADPAPGLTDEKLDTSGDLDAAIASGSVRAIPLLYEDFLPVSAAGIFQSNLGPSERQGYAAQAAQDAFEQALGCPVNDPFALYEAIERTSQDAVTAGLGTRAQEATCRR